MEIDRLAVEPEGWLGQLLRCEDKRRGLRDLGARGLWDWLLRCRVKDFNVDAGLAEQLSVFEVDSDGVVIVPVFLT